MPSMRTRSRSRRVHYGSIESLEQTPLIPDEDLAMEPRTKYFSLTRYIIIGVLFFGCGLLFVASSKWNDRYNLHSSERMESSAGEVALTIRKNIHFLLR